MITTSSSRVTADFGRNRLLQGLAAWYALLWAVMAIAPADRFDWFLENLLVFITVGLLAATYRVFPFSDLSYVLLTVFLSLHTVGAHYTYTEVPLGSWLQEAFALTRNHYDRIVHFCFGLLIVYPLHELILRAARIRGVWAYVLAFTSTFTISAAYEIVEWIVAEIVSPEAALAYLGTQGDVFDGQKDMSLAVTGAVIGLTLTALVRRAARARRRR